MTGHRTLLNTWNRGSTVQRYTTQTPVKHIETVEISTVQLMTTSKSRNEAAELWGEYCMIIRPIYDEEPMLRTGQHLKLANNAELKAQIRKVPYVNVNMENLRVWLLKKLSISEETMSKSIISDDDTDQMDVCSNSSGLNLNANDGIEQKTGFKPAPQCQQKFLKQLETLNKYGYPNITVEGELIGNRNSMQVSFWVNENCKLADSNTSVLEDPLRFGVETPLSRRFFESTDPGEGDEDNDLKNSKSKAKGSLRSMITKQNEQKTITNKTQDQ
ncbi:hypothetical protein Tco_0908571 [Tanacetum coccineum]|uniref:Uncharacterized protein n=1 Tax=Tanacetum coccineum TaxID=301880 RepID=A0ABQ5CMK2_9ASTR